MRIRNATGEVLEEVEENEFFEETLWDYIVSKVPPPAPEQQCEAERHNETAHLGGVAAWATTFVYTIQGDHICYTYVCWECAENSVGGFESPTPRDVPTMGGGYIQEPVHCSY